MLNLWRPALLQGVDFEYVYITELKGGDKILWFKTPVEVIDVRQLIGGMSINVGKRWYSYDSTTEVRKVKEDD